MTLVEIIVTIAVLGILAVMITPVFSGAFAIVSGNGERSSTSHDGASRVEGMLSSQTALPTPLITMTIDIPGMTGGNAPTADKYQVEQEGTHGNVVFSFFISWFTGGSDGGVQPGVTPIPSPTPVPEVEPTDGVLDDSTTALLAAALEKLTLTGEDWTESNKYARIVPTEPGYTVPSTLLVWFSQTTSIRADDAVYYEYSKLETISVPDNNKNLYAQIFFAGVPARSLTLYAAPSRPEAQGGDPDISAAYQNYTGSGNSRRYNYLISTTLSYLNLEYYAVQQNGAATGWQPMPPDFKITGYFTTNNANKNYIAVRFKSSSGILPSLPTVDLLK